jgi:hypothetical protein
MPYYYLKGTGKLKSIPPFLNYPRSTQASKEMLGKLFVLEDSGR